MSYPGYPYGSGGNAPPYPQGPPYPQSGNPPPNPAPNSAPYPAYGNVFPPSLGYSTASPMYMPPQDYTHPLFGAYMPQSTAYAAPYSGGHSHMAAHGGYPQPPAEGGYPQPPAQGGYPQPPAQGGFPPPTATNPGYYTSSYRPPPNQSGASGYPYGNAQAEQGYQSTQSHAVQSSRPARKKLTPTIFPAAPFDPVGDAEILRKAMKGFGTDEKAIIHVLGKRTTLQRLEIAVQFKTLYGKDLVKDLKSETSGNFENLLVYLMTPYPVLYAKHVREALAGIGTDEEVLIEVFCTKTNAEIQTIRAAYQTEFGRDLEDDLRSDTSGTFKRVLVSLCNAARDESMYTDIGAAVADAQSLLDAGENQWGTDESTFNMILCQRNHAQLKLIFDEYEKLSGVDIEDTIKSEFSGDSEDAFLAIVRSIRNTPYFYAKCLHDAISGIGTKDNKLMRITATRCEIDMGDIKTEYANNYGESLADAISGDTSGHYKKLLLSLIGEY